MTLRAGAAEWALAVVTGFLFLGVLVAVTAGSQGQKDVVQNPQIGGTTRLGYAFLGMTEAADMHAEGDRMVADSDINPVTGMPPGSSIRGRTRVAYLLPFEIVSVHLLVVLIGAAYLARAKRRRGAAA